jgi:hypothetical protein
MGKYATFCGVFRFLRKEASMKKAVGLLVIIFAAGVLLSGCATPFPHGIFYTEIKSPIAAGDAGSGSKVGMAKATSILGLVATGDASIKAAMDNGKITKIKYVDYESKNILGVYGEYTTVVYGD